MASKEEAMRELARRELERRTVQNKPMQSATSGQQPRLPDFSRQPAYPDPVSPGFFEGAPFTTMMKGAFVDDPETKRRIYAKGLFPNLPEEEALVRVGFTGDEVTYYDPKESPLGLQRKFAQPGGFTGGLKSFAAEQPAYLPAEVLGVIGASTGVPFLAGLGVAGGEGIRKSIGATLFDEPQTVGGNVAGMTTMGLLGGYLPTVAGNYLGRKLQRGVVRDIGSLDVDDMKRLSLLSKEKGIPLTVAEKTNLGSLKGYQTALGNITDSADDMARFYASRGEAVDRAVGKALQDISPIDSAEQAAAKAVTATTGAREAIKSQMKAKARPFYEKAYESGPVDIEDIVSGIDETIMRYPENSSTIRALNKAKSLLTTKTPEGRVPQTDFSILDYAKRDIDDLINTAKRKGENNIVRELTSHKNVLLSKMDDLSPDYKVARQIWTEGSDALDKIDSTAVKVIANLPEEKYQTAAVRMFNPKTTGPDAVKKAREVIAKQDSGAWDGLVRAYIESAWEDAGDVASGSRGATFKRMIFGGSSDSKKARTLKAAMSPEQFKSFSDLMDILDATGRVKAVGSDTAYKQEIIKELNEKWGSGWNDLARPTSWIKENLSRARIGKNAKKMAEILTTQDGVESIKLIKQLKPGSQEKINAVATLLGITATSGSGAPDMTPPAMLQERQ